MQYNYENNYSPEIPKAKYSSNDSLNILNPELNVLPTEQDIILNENRRKDQGIVKQEKIKSQEKVNKTFK